MHKVAITKRNSNLEKLKLNWGRHAFTSHDGLGPLDSLHQASDAIVSVSREFGEGFKSIGSGVMVGPGLVLTASHVLDEMRREGPGPVLLSFLPENKARAWLPTSTVACSGPSEYHLEDPDRKKVSDLTIVSCDLHSDEYLDYPLTLVPIELCLPLPDSRL
jgi:hypothetical protein